MAWATVSLYIAFCVTFHSPCYNRCLWTCVTLLFLTWVDIQWNWQEQRWHAMKVGVAVVQCSSQSYIMLLPISCMLITSIFLFIFCRCTFDCTVFCHCFPDQIVVYKRLAGAYPLRDFHKICRICTKYQDALAVKIWLDLLDELWSYGGYVEGAWLPPNFQHPLAAKVCVRPRKVLEVQERARGTLSPCQVWWGWDFTRRRGGQNVEFLSVCLSVTLLNVRGCAPDFAMKALEYINEFYAVG